MRHLTNMASETSSFIHFKGEHKRHHWFFDKLHFLERRCSPLFLGWRQASALREDRMSPVFCHEREAPDIFCIKMEWVQKAQWTNTEDTGWQMRPAALNSPPTGNFLRTWCLYPALRHSILSKPQRDLDLHTVETIRLWMAPAYTLDSCQNHRGFDLHVCLSFPPGSWHIFVKITKGNVLTNRQNCRGDDYNSFKK